MDKVIGVSTKNKEFEADRVVLATQSSGLSKIFQSK